MYVPPPIVSQSARPKVIVQQQQPQQKAADLSLKKCVALQTASTRAGNNRYFAQSAAYLPAQICGTLMCRPSCQIGVHAGLMSKTSSPVQGRPRCPGGFQEIRLRLARSEGPLASRKE